MQNQPPQAEQPPPIAEAENDNTDFETGHEPTAETGIPEEDEELMPEEGETPVPDAVDEEQDHTEVTPEAREPEPAAAERSTGEDPNRTTAVAATRTETITVSVKEWKGRTATKEDGQTAAAQIADRLADGPVRLDTRNTATSGGWVTQHYAEGLAAGIKTNPGKEGLTVITPGPLATRVIEFMGPLTGTRINAEQAEK